MTNTAAGQVKLAYTAAAANGAPILRYEVCSSLDGKKFVAWWGGEIRATEVFC